MRNAGITGLTFAPFDLWNDGNQDWLFIADIYGDYDEPVSMLAVWFQDQWVLFQIDWLLSDSSSIFVDQIDLPGIDQPIVLIKVDEEFDIVELEIRNGELNLNFLLPEWIWVTEYHLHNIKDILELHTFWLLEENIDDEIVETFIATSYYWDESKKEFIEDDVVEDLILNQGRYEDAIVILNKDFQIFQQYYGYVVPPSSYLYLLGLAYELNGDEALAVKTYYQLWREHPDNPYALMARAKLEVID